MEKSIGFSAFPRGWEGPVILDFERYMDHTRVVRYRCRLESRQFDLYAPKFMLPGVDGDESPPRVRVAMGKSRQRFRSVGFHGKPETASTGPGICTFDFCEEKANSKRYNLVHEGQTYSLYVPNEVFGDEPPPNRLFLQVALPT